jgi:hypothetical protein
MCGGLRNGCGVIEQIKTRKSRMQQEAREDHEVKKILAFDDRHCS